MPLEVRGEKNKVDFGGANCSFSSRDTCCNYTALKASHNLYLVSSSNCWVIVSISAESAAAIFNSFGGLLFLLHLIFHTTSVSLTHTHTHTFILVLLLCSLLCWASAKVSIQSIHICDSLFTVTWFILWSLPNSAGLFWELQKMTPLFFCSFSPPPSSYSSLKEETAKEYSPQRRNCRHFERNIKPKEGEKGLECIDLSFRLPLYTRTHTISGLFMIKCTRLSAQEITRCSDFFFFFFFLNPKSFPDYFIFIFCLCSASFFLSPALSPFLSPKLPTRQHFFF